MQTKRIIGITHRVKQIIRGGEVQEEERPTLVAISDESGPIVEYELSTETDELDFVLGRFPSAWRDVDPAEDIGAFVSHHVKWKKHGANEPEGCPKSHKKLFDDLWHTASKVPSAYDGLREGDTVSMMLGGSGDRLAYALSRRADTISALVYRVPPFVVKRERDKVQGDKKHDHKLLVTLFESRPDDFRFCGARDRDLIRVTEAYRHRMEAQVERIGCAHRLRQRFIGSIFLSPAGQYPEGRIEDSYEAVAANDVILSALVAEEKKREAELKKIVQSLAVWRELLGPIEGVGEMIAARLISAVGDIRRFPTAAKLKAFAGVHVFGPDGKKTPLGADPAGGKFVRRRAGTVADWNPTLRQALYLLGDQFNRRPDSVWGRKLREYKVKFQVKYPEPVVGEKGKKRYTKGHIHKMATWRTITKFAEWLWREWTRLEKRAEASPEVRQDSSVVPLKKKAA